MTDFAQESPLLGAFECLRLEPGAGILDIERAYQRMKQLYAENSLATYSLLDEESRRLRLEEIEEAYRRLRGSFERTEAAPSLAEGEPEAAACIDVEEFPGLYLKTRRLQLALSLRDISRRTKIGSFNLENIEEEKFQHLPAPVYLRGFVIEFARALGLPDPEVVAHHYLRSQEKKAPNR